MATAQPRYAEAFAGNDDTLQVSFLKASILADDGSTEGPYPSVVQSALPLLFALAAIKDRTCCFMTPGDWYAF